MAYGILVVLALVYMALVMLLSVKLVEAAVRIISGVGFDPPQQVVDSGLLGACGMLACCASRKRKAAGKGKGTGRAGRGDKYKPAGESPLSAHAGSGLLNTRRASDLSSYIPPAALLAGDGSDRGSIIGPRFLGGAEARKQSTHSQPPSVLRPEHANQPYREDIDREWWNENEDQDGSFIMGAWQPSGGNQASQSNYAGSSGVSSQQETRHLLAPPKTTPQASTPSTGFSRIGGGRAHIDSPYAITPTGNNHSQLGLMSSNGQAGSSTHAFPSTGANTAQVISAVPSQRTSSAGTHHPSAISSYPPSSFYRHNQSNPSPSYLDDDEPPIPLSSVRLAHPSPTPMPQHYHNELEALPVGGIMPSHNRTKSQTAIIEDAGTSLYASGGATTSSTATSANPAATTSISARLSLPSQAALQPLKIPSPGSSAGLSASNNPNSANYLKPPPGSAPPMFTLAADDDDGSGDSGAEDQQQKKKWYQIRKKRPHSSEGRTTTTTNNTRPSTADGSTASIPAQTFDQEFGGVEGGLSGGSTPQRSFVVIRKPMGSMGRLNQPGSGSGTTTRSTARSRPPTR